MDSRRLARRAPRAPAVAQLAAARALLSSLLAAVLPALAPAPPVEALGLQAPVSLGEIPAVGPAAVPPVVAQAGPKDGFPGAEGGATGAAATPPL